MLSQRAPTSDGSCEARDQRRTYCRRADRGPLDQVENGHHDHNQHGSSERKSR